MPENDISDITLEDVLGDLRAEGIDVGIGSQVAGAVPSTPPTPDAALRRRLDGMASREVRTLHDRRRPWTFLTLRHLVVCPAGVVVVDPLETRGRPSLRLESGRDGRQTERLVAGDRDCSKQVDSLLDGVRAVARSLARSLPEVPGVDVHGVLASISDDGPTHGRALTVHGIHVLCPARLGARIAGPGPLRSHEIELVTDALAKAFPPA